MSAAPADRSSTFSSVEPHGGLLAGASLLSAATLISLQGALWADIRMDWAALSFWLLVVLAVEVMPLYVWNVTLSIDLPVLLAVAFLYSPGVAALVALLGASDSREIRKEVTWTRAVFNRSQVALSVYAASLTFHALGGFTRPIPLLVLGAGLALAADYLVNIGLVAVWWRIVGRLAARETIRRLRVGQPVQFLAAYLGVGLLALVMATAFDHEGPAPILLFLIPTFLARQFFVKSQLLENLTAKLRRQDQLLNRSLVRMIDERKDERIRISGDLHDEVLQSITKIWMVAKLLESDESLPSESRDDVRELVRVSDDSMLSLRSVIKDLRESPLARGGLVPSVNSLVKELRLDWQIPIGLEASVGGDLAIPGEQQIALYQVAREGLVNALKHSECSRITVRVASAEDSIEISVEDDGRGFNPTDSRVEDHFGLGLMEERIVRVGGELSIRSKRGAGTTLIGRVPIKAVPAPGTE